MAATTDKPADKPAAASEAKPEQPTQQKSAAALEEDDEFEDFPVEGASAVLVLLDPICGRPTVNEISFLERIPRSHSAPRTNYDAL